MSYPDGNPAAGGVGPNFSPVAGHGAAGRATGANERPPGTAWQSGAPGPDFPTSGGQPSMGSGRGGGPAPLGQPVSPVRPIQRPPRRADPARLLGLAVAVLGGLNFCFGFLPEVSAPRLGETLSVYAVGPAYVPILLLIAGLLALAAFLPGSERSRLAVAAVSVGGAVGAIVSLGTPGSFELFANPNQVTAGLGAILLVVFGIVQAVVAIGAYVIGADSLWSAGRPATAGSPAVPTGYSGEPVGYPARPYGYPAGATGYTSARGYAGSPAGYTTGAPGYTGAAGYASAAGYAGSPAGYAGAAGYIGAPAGNPGAAGPLGSTTRPAAGWVPVPAPLQTWPRPDEPATGPQVIVGTEADRPDHPRNALSTSDTGPVAVVQPDDPAGVAEEPVSLSKRDGDG
jgi:hypothetical protein